MYWLSVFIVLLMLVNRLLLDRCIALCQYPTHRVAETYNSSVIVHLLT